MMVRKGVIGVAPTAVTPPPAWASPGAFQKCGGPVAPPHAGAPSPVALRGSCCDCGFQEWGEGGGPAGLCSRAARLSGREPSGAARFGQNFPGI